MKVLKILVDATVEASFPIRYQWGEESPEEKAQRLELSVQEFDEFLRDHRSQDIVRLEVNRVYENQCSECHREYEASFEGGTEHCANCDSIREKEEKRTG